MNNTKMLVIVVDSSDVEQVEEPAIYLSLPRFLLSFVFQYKVGGKSSFDLPDRDIHRKHEDLVICQNFFVVNTYIFISRITIDLGNAQLFDKTHILIVLYKTK